MTNDLQVSPTLAIPRTDLVYRASRAGGAGGQHVNTSSTRIELLWDFQNSSAVDAGGKEMIRQKLTARIDADGFLRVVAGNRRSQLQNRVAADERLAELVRRALHVAKTRKKTRPSRASKEARLSSKKRRSKTKGNRRRDDFD
jgi:ribosome-associated protein